MISLIACMILLLTILLGVYIPLAYERLRELVELNRNIASHREIMIEQLTELIRQGLKSEL